MDKFMSIAIEEAFNGIRNNHGGPFGAVVVRNNLIIAKAHNQVIKDNDPTAHAEILAIRSASHNLEKFDLSDCELYSSCEPCPMCFAAIYWSRIKKIYYGCTRDDAAGIGFDDKHIYDVIRNETDDKNIELIQTDRDLCLKIFREWEVKEDRIFY